MIALLLMLGIPEALARTVATSDALGHRVTGDAAVRAGVRIVTLAGLAAIAVGLAAATVVGGNTPWIPLAAAALGGAVALQAVSGATLRARGRVWTPEVLHTIVPITFVVGLGLLGVMDRASDATTTAFRVLIEWTVAISLVVSALRIARGSAGRVRPLLMLALPLWITSLSWLAILQCDVVILGLLRPARTLALYVPVLRLAELGAVAFSVMGVYVLPSAARLAALADRRGLADLYATTTKITFAAGSPIFVALVLFPGAVAEALFGFSGGNLEHLARILAIGYVVNAVVGLNGVMLEATGRPRTLALRSALVLVAVVGIDLVLIARMGVLGAAWGTSIGLILTNAVNSTLLFKQTGIRPLPKDVLLTVGVGLLAIGASALVIGSDPSIVTACLTIAFVGIVCVTVAWRSSPAYIRTSLRESLVRRRA
jgi:O-antigen/teichoic acid export membrane protein